MAYVVRMNDRYDLSMYNVVRSVKWSVYAPKRLDGRSNTEDERVVFEIRICYN